MNTSRIQRTLGSLLLVGLLTSGAAAVVHGQSVNADSAIAELDSIVESISEMLEEAQGDVTWTNCLNPQLGSAEAAVTMASSAGARLETAMARGDSESVAVESALIEDALASARGALEVAASCQPLGAGQTARTVRRGADGTWSSEGTVDDSAVDDDPVGEFDQTDGRGSVSTILR